MQGAGADIWGTADQFHYVWQGLPADGGVSARVVTQTTPSGNAKAGVMLRASAAANAAYYAALVTPAHGVLVQYRATTGITATQAVSLTGAAPVYLEVARFGSVYTAYTSGDGVTWTAIAKSSKTLGMSGPILAGLAVTAHKQGVLGSATFDGVRLP